MEVSGFFDGRSTSITANNDVLNLNSTVYTGFYFDGTGTNGDLSLEGSVTGTGGGTVVTPDPDTTIWIDLDGDSILEEYNFALETAGLLPATAEQADTGDKVPAQYEGDQVYKIAILDAEGNIIEKIVFDPSGEIDATDWQTFDSGNITLSFQDTEPQPVCFLAGSLLRSTENDVAVESLSAGDELITHAGAVVTIKWIGSNPVQLIDLLANPSTRPVCIPAGAFGDGTPTTDLWVSPQHRVLVQGHLAETLFGVPEVLVAAKHLDFGDLAKGKKRPAEVEYFHILLDKHDVLIANGAPAESLFLGDQAQTMLSDESLAEIEAQFPRDEHPEMWNGKVLAPTLTAAEAMVLSQALRGDLQNAKDGAAAA